MLFARLSAPSQAGIAGQIPAIVRGSGGGVTQKGQGGVNMIKRFLIIVLVLVTAILTAGSASAAPVSLTGGDTTIAGLIAMPDKQRMELTKDQMMMMTKDQMILLTERMIIKKLIRTVMDKTR